MTQGGGSIHDQGYPEDDIEEDDGHLADSDIDEESKNEEGTLDYGFDQLGGKRMLS